MARGSQFARQWEVLNLLGARRYGLTLEELAQELEFHPRTLRRDLEVLEGAGFPIEREREPGTRRVKVKLAAAARAPQIPFTLAEVLAIYFAGNLLGALRGTPMKEGIDTALAKIERSLPVHALDHLVQARHALAARPGPFKDYHAHVETLGKLQQAVAETRKLDLVYRAYGRPEPDRHTVHAYGVTFSDGALYLVGHSETRGAMRVYRVDRIEQATLRSGRFVRPEDFEVDEYLGEAFGMCHEDRTHEVRIEFGPRDAPWIREREWHPTQKLEEVAGGGVILGMRVAGLQDVLWWVLSFGSGAKVLAPEELRDRVSDELAQAASYYCLR